jgi:Xaa-Pro aminopeptidase
VRAEERVAALRSSLAQAEIAVAVVTDPVNVAYLTGFEGVFDGEDAHAVVIGESDRLLLYTDGRYAEAAAQAAAGGPWEVCVAPRNLLESVCDDLASAGVESAALEDSVPHSRFRFVDERLTEGATAMTGLVERIRQVKDAEEISRIEAAQALTDAAFEHILAHVREGLSEREIALELEFFMRRNGSEGVAFPPIVASGPNSARPHATVSTRAIQRGDFVKLDFGARVGGYCADMTRTLVVGRASERQRELHDAVRAANGAGTAAVAAGVIGSDVDAAARRVLDERGLGALFTHGLGHGVGLEVHELPNAGPRSDLPLPAGSVITIEPGVYEPGMGGVRIEDLVVVEERGARVLTRSSKDLIEL